MRHPLLVTAALIQRNGRYLLTQRPNDSRPNGGRWEFPGGKVHFGEDPRICLRRELEEELGIHVKVGNVVRICSHVYNADSPRAGHIILLAFKAEIVSGTPKKKDVADYAWVAPDHMDSFDITEADLPLLDCL